MFLIKTSENKIPHIRFIITACSLKIIKSPAPKPVNIYKFRQLFLDFVIPGFGPPPNWDVKLVMKVLRLYLKSSVGYSAVVSDVIDCKS